MIEKLPYDDANPKSIEAYARQLLNHSLKSALIKNSDMDYGGRGGFGQKVEELYFLVKNNSMSQPDFPKAGVELKTNPIKKIKKGYSSKERLVFNIINYMEDYADTFFESGFWKKNQHLLLMMYLYEKNLSDADYIFKIIRLWKFPENDLKIIKDDWEKIIAKIKEGKAHELSEGDTLYLSACTKGADRNSLRKQPFSDKLAMQRAFALKPKYLKFIIKDNLPETEASIKPEDGFLTKKQTFEELVISKFKPYYGMTEDQIADMLQIELSQAKNKRNILCKAILGVKRKNIQEFEKADVMMKTIMLGKNGNPKESMSFAQIDYKTIIDEIWDESYLYDVLTKRFFFVIFQKSLGVSKLKKVKFWTMPAADLEIAKQFWIDTQQKIKNDDYRHFIKISDDMICHVRPKARNAKDLMDTPSGRHEKKKCYWLNSSYVIKAIEDY